MISTQLVGVLQTLFGIITKNSYDGEVMLPEGKEKQLSLMRQCWKEMLILPVKLSLMYMQLGIHLVVLLIK